MSTSIIIHRKNGIGRLNLFDDASGVSMNKINQIANEWRNFFSEKIEIVKTNDSKCVPNFAHAEG